MQKAVQEMVFVCPLCCEAKGKPYRFDNNFSPPRDEEAHEKCRQCRAKRLKIMKRRRLDGSGSGGEEPTDAGREEHALDGEQRKKKKLKVDIRDAELFVEKIKRRFAQVSNVNHSIVV